MGNDRERNMVAFSEQALRLLLDVLTGAEVLHESGSEAQGKDDGPSRL